MRILSVFFVLAASMTATNARAYCCALEEFVHHRTRPWRQILGAASNEQGPTTAVCVTFSLSQHRQLTTEKKSEILPNLRYQWLTVRRATFSTYFRQKNACVPTSSYTIDLTLKYLLSFGVSSIHRQHGPIGSHRRRTWYIHTYIRHTYHTYVIHSRRTSNKL